MIERLSLYQKIALLLRQSDLFTNNLSTKYAIFHRMDILDRFVVQEK